MRGRGPAIRLVVGVRSRIQSLTRSSDTLSPRAGRGEQARRVEQRLNHLAVRRHLDTSPSSPDLSQPEAQSGQQRIGREARPRPPA